MKPSTRKERKDELESLLKILAGYEISIGLALDDKDWELLKELRSQRSVYYKKIKVAIYGLKEIGKTGAEK